MNESDGIDDAVEGAGKMALIMSGRSLEDVARQLERLWRERQAPAEKAAREAELRQAAEGELGLGMVPGRSPGEAVPQLEHGPHGGEVVPANLGQEPWTAKVIMERTLWAKQYDPRLFDPMAEAVGRGDEEGTRRAFENITNSWRNAPEQQRQWARDTVATALKERTGSRDEADTERGRGRDELGESARLMIESEQAGRAGEPEHAEVVHADADRFYDSAQRRDAMAAELEAAGAEPEVVEARVLADISQARPGSSAVAAGEISKAPKARKGRAAARKLPHERAAGR